ncbi:MAG: hypothetical protein F4Z66_00640 [Gammaproteobacteria bacterium]|nr:hypothetical protein [Gammaproteobacteria bacterium]
MAGLGCKNTEGKVEQSLANESGIKPQILENCDPDLGLTLYFTSPVSLTVDENFPEVTPLPNLERIRFERNFSAGRGRDSLVRINLRDERWLSTPSNGYFKIDFRLQLNGNTEYSIGTGTKSMVDVFGRELTLENPLTFRTGHIKPRLERLNPVTVQEIDSEFEVPIEFANLEKLQIELEVRNSEENSLTQQERVVDFGGLVDRVGNETLNISDWLHMRNGEFIARAEPIAYSYIGENPPKSCIYGQFTPYNLQARVGLTSSIAWVTDLETGDVVSDATVDLVQLETDQRHSILETKTDQEGIATFLGKADLSGFPLIDRGYSGHYGPSYRHICEDVYNSKYALKVAGPKGFAILPLEQAFAELEYRGVFHDEPHFSVWGHTAQGIYSPGDALQYKIYVRKQTGYGLDKVNKGLKFILVVVGSRGELVDYRNGIELNEFGSFHGGFQVPLDVLGSLKFIVLIDGGKSLAEIREMLPDLAKAEYGKPRGYYDSHWVALTVDVLDFIPATIRLESKLNSDSYRNRDAVTVRGRTELLSGGPFTSAAVTVRTEFLPKRFVSEFPQTKSFKFADSAGGNTPSAEGQSDSNGAFQVSRKIAFDKFFYGTMKVSTGVRSDRGDFVWDYQHAQFRTGDRFLGIRLKERRNEVGSPVSVDAVVTDISGRPRDDLPISIEFARMNEGRGYSSRWTNVHYCGLEEDTQPKSCAYTPGRSGYYRVTASIESEKELKQIVRRNFFVRGKPQTAVYDGSRGSFNIRDRRDPYWREHEYRVGEVAEIEVEHTFPNNKALVTVERLGILDQWVVELEGDLQSVDIPIKKEYWPRVRVNMVAMVPDFPKHSRQEEESNQGPTHPDTIDDDVFLSVLDPERSLQIEVNADKDIFEPGETVRVSVNARTGDGSKLTSPVEFAVAVVDQGVLEVSKAGLEHFDPILGLSSTFEFDVQGFGLLSRGYSYFVSGSFLPGLRAVHGPRQKPRENTELLSHWIPVLRTNEEGEASFDFEVGDRLTEWKIIVVAADSADQFGRGYKSIKTRLDLEIHPVLPNQITDTDIFDASYSVLNRTDSERAVRVAIETSGDVDPNSFEDSITLKSYERKIVTFPQTVSPSANKRPQSGGSIRLLATVTSDELSDAVVQTLSVQPDKRIAIHSIYGTSISSQVAEPVEFPRDVKKDTGSLKVVVTPSLIRSLDDKLSQIKDYPYDCWEQQLSKAVIAAKYGGLKKHFDLEWPQADEYLQSVLGSASDYQTSLGGFDYWSDGGGYSSPFLSAYTAQALKWMGDEGHDIQDAVVSGLLAYLQNQLENGQSSRGQISGDTARSLRAMIMNALVQHGLGDTEKVESFFRENENLSPFALTQTLQAALSVDAPRELLDELAARLANSIAVSGDKAMIQHDVVRNGNVLLSSMLRTTCSAISTFVQARDNGRPLISDERLASLVRGAVYEWNKPKPRAVPHPSAFCLNAIAAYTTAMETEIDELDISVKVAMGRRNQNVPRVRRATGDSNVEFAMFETALNRRNLGKTGELVLSQRGESRLYYRATLQYEPIQSNNQPQNHGIDISKSYWIKQGEEWHEIDDSSKLQRGDLVRVRLVLDIRDPLDFVIVDDPVPGAFEPVDPRLATTNIDDLLGEYVLNDVLQERISDVWLPLGFVRTGFYRRELRHESVRFVSDFLDSGEHEMQWTARVIATGDFLSRPAHAESMYSPEIYGKSSARRLIVEGE